ncbi:DUF4376 domain-containing protein [Salmonella enterica]|nr:DUF4376 domain-containing protein [Salmonella enterica]
MVNIKNFKKGTPKTPEQLELHNKHRVIFLFSEDGQEWYEAQKQFAPDTIKIAYDSEGVIRSISRDVSALYPYELSVAEVPDTTANRRADISGRWGFNGESVVDLLTPEKARRKVHDAINRWRAEQEDGSVVFELNGHRWDAGKESQSRINPVLSLPENASLPSGFYWTDADNNDVPVTYSELQVINQGMIEAMVKNGWRIHERQREMKKEVESLSTVTDILNYQVGWPQ